MTFWSRNPNVVTSINRDRVNSSYLPGAPVPDGVLASEDIGEALNESQLVIIATPSHATRAILVNMSSMLPANAILVSATKGIEIDTGKRISQLVTEVLGDSLTDRFVCLSGPSFAKEVVSQHPTAIVAAGVNPEVAATVQSTLSTEYLRIYTNDDVVGTELGGSVKNVMAIAAGMVAGLGLGANSVAALITRGLAEMSRLALAEGGKLETMMGLAGLGDLVLTCTGSLSRNRFVGQELGKGRALTEITAGMSEVAEGVKTTRALNVVVPGLEHRIPARDEELPLADELLVVAELLRTSSRLRWKRSQHSAMVRA